MTFHSSLILKNIDYLLTAAILIRYLQQPQNNRATKDNLEGVSFGCRGGGGDCVNLWGDYDFSHFEFNELSVVLVLHQYKRAPFVKTRQFPTMVHPIRVRVRDGFPHLTTLQNVQNTDSINKSSHVAKIKPPKNAYL